MKNVIIVGFDPCFWRDRKNRNALAGNGNPFHPKVKGFSLHDLNPDDPLLCASNACAWQPRLFASDQNLVRFGPWTYVSRNTCRHGLKPIVDQVPHPERVLTLVCE